MAGCKHAITDEGGDLCLLCTNRQSDGAPTLVFHGSREFIPVVCDIELFRACPFKLSQDGNELSKRGTVRCSHCGGAHVPGSINGRMCGEWLAFKRAYQEMRKELPGKRKYYLQGTRRPVYSEGCDEFIRRQLWHRVQLSIIRRDRFTCQECGRDYHKLAKRRSGKAVLEVHHIVPRAMGGTDHPGNLMTLCGECHRKHTREDADPIRRAAEMERLVSIADPSKDDLEWDDDEIDDMAFLGHERS